MSFQKPFKHFFSINYYNSYNIPKLYSKFIKNNYQNRKFQYKFNEGNKINLYICRIWSDHMS